MLSQLILVTLGLMIASAGAAEPIVEFERGEEINLALSAAPEHLRDEAGVYVLAAVGYELVRPSKNGFVCLVEREPSLGIAPVCHDSEGSRTLVPATLVKGRLQREGKSPEEIRAELDAQYAAGQLSAPRRPGIAYMLSHHFSRADATGARRCIFPAHLMFYAPYLRNNDIGAQQSHRGSTAWPWVLNEGRPNAYVLVVPAGSDIAACK